MGVCLGIYFNVFNLTHAFGFDSLRSEWKVYFLESTQSSTDIRVKWRHNIYLQLARLRRLAGRSRSAAREPPSSRPAGCCSASVDSGVRESRRVPRSRAERVHHPPSTAASETGWGCSSFVHGGERGGSSKSQMSSDPTDTFNDNPPQVVSASGWFLCPTISEHQMTQIAIFLVLELNEEKQRF